ncbi:hypothetical protein [Streptomyces globosus]|uniref:hypothetical protein n=1 Tax=Streptomyces globosus TaxID=68209 RepID=UPI0031D9EE78
MHTSRSRTLAAAVATAALLAGTAACGAPDEKDTRAGRAPTQAPGPAEAKKDPLAGKDPADVLRRAYETTQQTVIKKATVSTTIDGRNIRADLSTGGTGFCEGQVTVYKAGTAQLRTRGDTILVKGDSGFLKDAFRDRPEAEAQKAADEAAGRSLELSATDRAAADLTAVCKQAAAPATAFSMERTDIRREPDTASNGRDLAVFTSTDANGAKITDKVMLTGTDQPYLFQRNQQTGNDFGETEYRIEPRP